MMNKTKYDEIIKGNLLKSMGKDVFGYVVSESGKEPYTNYYDNETFQLFIDEMESSYANIYNSYKEGKGSELYEKNGRYGKTPPKMASVASSSRFCYLALRDGADGIGGTGIVKFEHECKINGVSGTAPQLDAYIANENIYVEAKCHEIFDSHKIVMKEKYWNYIYGENKGFGLENIEKNEDDTFEIPLSAFGIEKSNTMFDIKQFLCHLLGISSQKNTTDSATLVYLFFKPKTKDETERMEIEEVFDELQVEINKIFSSTPIQRFIKNNNIELKAVAEYSVVMESLNSENMITLF